MNNRDRVSMFNNAQMADIASKKEVVKAQKIDDRFAEKPEKIFSVRVPRDMWEQMMQIKIRTDKSLNTQILEALESYLGEEYY